MITHDQFIFCLCMLDSRIKRSEHGTKYLVVMPIYDDGDQAGDAFIDRWDYDFEPPSREDIDSYWEQSGHLFEIDPMCEGLEVAQRRRRDQLLEELDKLTTNPFRWAELNESDQAALAQYRTLLLDVPQQEGFPENIDWPVAPVTV